MELVIVVLTVYFSLIIVTGDSVSGTRISEKKCDDYRKRLSTMTMAFYSDEDAAPKEYPFMARIENDTYNLNGILISENFVISTASASEFLSGKTVVVLGDLEEGTNAEDALPRSYDIVETFVHPNYNKLDRRSDIKLFKLNESVTFDEYVRPACLSLNRYSIPQQMLEIGWGITNIRSNNRLHKVKLSHLSGERCKQNRHHYQMKFIKEIDNGTIFCARPQEGDRFMCGGFSGSAVINEFNEIVGIASVALGCNYDTLNVFVRLSAYIDWIESIVWGDGEETSKMIKVKVKATRDEFEIKTEKEMKNLSQIAAETVRTFPSTSVVATTTTTTTTQSNIHILVVIATVILLTLLCGSIICLKSILRPTNRQDPVIVLLNRGNDSIWLNSPTISIK